jgi:hypothetical protein
MSGLAVLALVLASIWLGVLTLVIVLLVRQPPSLDHDGPEVGSYVPEEVRSALPHLEGERAYILLVSATCGSCREVIADLEGHYFEQRVTALMPGSKELANELAALLPPGVQAVLDPEATKLADALKIRSTPFAVEVEGGTVTRKAYLYGKGSDFIEFVEQEPLPSKGGGFARITSKEEAVRASE